MPVFRWIGLAAVTTVLALAATAHASLVAIPPGAFSDTASLITYGTVSTQAPVNGATIDGVLHRFTIGGVASNDAVIDGGPGNTNNITIANIEGSTNGVLSLTFASPMTRLGFGWAIRTGPGGTIRLFDPVNALLGSLIFVGAPDPMGTGGFAGVESTIAFTRFDVSWNTPASPFNRFALDNVRFENAATAPEPSGWALLGIAAWSLVVARRKHPSSLLA